MWDVTDIKRKQKKVIKELITCKEPEKKEILIMTLSCYYYILKCIENSHFQITNIFTEIILKNYILELHSIRDIFISNSYLKLLKQLIFNIAAIENELSNNNNITLKDLTDYNINDLKTIAIAFYYELGDKEIFNYAKKIIENDKYLYFTTKFPKQISSNTFGFTINDYIYNESYYAIKVSSTVLDIMTLTHEIMHGINFYLSCDLSLRKYYGFEEVAPQTINFLILDYLEKMKFNKEEIYKIKQIIINTMQSQANSLILDKDNNFISTPIYNLNSTTKDQLLQVESNIIAYGLYKQIKENKEYGLNNLKKFIKTNIPKDKKPNFSYIDLPDEKLLSLSLEMNNYLNNNNSINKSKKKIKKIDK